MDPNTWTVPSRFGAGMSTPRIGRSKSLFGVGKMGRHFDFQISQYLGASHVCRNAPVIALWNRVFGSTTFAFYVDGDPNFHQLDSTILWKLDQVGKMCSGLGLQVCL